MSGGLFLDFTEPNNIDINIRPQCYAKFNRTKSILYINLHHLGFFLNIFFNAKFYLSTVFFRNSFERNGVFCVSVSSVFILKTFGFV
jgi:hypothetical protein